MRDVLSKLNPTPSTSALYQHGRMLNTVHIQKLGGANVKPDLVTITVQSTDASGVRALPVSHDELQLLVDAGIEYLRVTSADSEVDETVKRPEHKPEEDVYV